MRAIGKYVHLKPIEAQKHDMFVLPTENTLTGEIIDVGHLVKDLQVGQVVFYSKFASKVNDVIVVHSETISLVINK